MDTSTQARRALDSYSRGLARFTAERAAHVPTGPDAADIFAATESARDRWQSSRRAGTVAALFRGCSPCQSGTMHSHPSRMADRAAVALVAPGRHADGRVTL